MPSGTHAA